MVRIEELGQWNGEENAARDSRPRESKWAAVVRVLRKHYHEPDIKAARALYAAVAAHDLAGQPVWPMAIAPPGSMKSELITALEGMPNVFLVDALTTKTFLSGQIPDDRTPTDRKASLLHRIGESGIILIPDFSTVQSMKSEDRTTILATLRKIFDGKFSKEFGTAEKVEAWSGRITVVVGTTPEIDRTRAATQALGERFVMVRWPRAGVEAARKAILQDPKKVHAEVRAAVHRLLTDLPPGDVAIADTWQDRIVKLAEIAVLGRTNVHRNPTTKEIEEEPQPESATRLSQQLCQLSKGSARLERRAEVSQPDFELAKRVAFDCIPPRRKEILAAVAGKRPIPRTSSTTHYDFGELEALGLLLDNELSEKGAELFRAIEG
jgi:hypothetical protein